MVRGGAAARRARSDVRTRRGGDEGIVLDLRTNEVHLLRGDLAVGWDDLCSGSPSAQLDSTAVAVLDGLGLLEPRAGIDRRTVLAAAGLAAVALPAVESIMAPPAVAAASGGPVTLAWASGTHTLTVPNGVTV